MKNINKSKVAKVDACCDNSVQKAQEELLEKLELSLEKMRKELGVVPTVDQLDEVFYLRDYAVKEGIMSIRLSRWACGRIVDTYTYWASYLHSLIMPNPGSLFSLTESQTFNEEEKENMGRMISTIMSMVSANILAGLTKDRKAEGKFINSAYDYWVNTFNPNMRVIISKANNMWTAKAAQYSDKEQEKKKSQKP
ncbi:MAG TPA: hypothetical protein VJI75_05955 [Candidatus Nanoarchaeia archaeon]|nr:hypothetical protein [Candidatus Nanoarchaeia archaeon]